MKIVSWNVNGIRSLKDDSSWAFVLAPYDADVVCIQETKVTRDLLEERVALEDGYTSYFSFSRRKSGYSGVATFCKLHATPLQAEEGLSGCLNPELTDGLGHYQGIGDEFSGDELKALDAEGRCVLTKHNVSHGLPLVIINVYCPRAERDEDPERVPFKLKFYKLLELRAQALKDAGHRVVIVGDVNTSHKKIDHCNPSEDFGTKPGRRWMDHFLHGKTVDGSGEWEIKRKSCKGGQFVDAFRHFHPDRQLAFTCWNTKMNCRSTNFGTRIDYALVDVSLVRHLTACEILSHVRGSDHCPVVAEMDLVPIPSSKLPSSCTKNFPEFLGKQKKLRDFFVPKSAVQRSPPPHHHRQMPSAKKRKTQKTLTTFFSRKKVEEEAAAASAGVEEKAVKSEASAMAWKVLMKGPPPAPPCKGHSEASVLRTVKKAGKNQGKQFWCCARGEGRKDDVNARCDFFQWR